jgi:hypothetical protein
MASSKAGKLATILGWIIGLLPIPLFLLSAYFKFAGGPEVEEGMGKYGWPMSTLLALGIVETVCVLLYVFPRTAVLGAVLLTGYLGGAIATHARIGDAWWTPVLIGVLLWLGLYLRDPRLRTLLPLRR